MILSFRLVNFLQAEFMGRLPCGRFVTGLSSMIFLGLPSANVMYYYYDRASTNFGIVQLVVVVLLQTPETHTRTGLHSTLLSILSL